MKRSVVVVILAGLLWAPGVWAQSVPPQLSFTGNLTGTGGPVSGPHNFVFTLFDSSSTAVWTETLNGLQVNNGLVYATLGNVTPFSGTILNGAPLNLEVSVDGNVLSPRVPVLSVPFAIRAGVAASAQTLGTLLPSDVQRRVTGVCTGANAVQSIDAAGSVSCVAIPSAVTSVTATAPLSSTGGATPNISIASASAGSSGALSAADWSAFNAKVSSVGANAPLSSSGGSSPTISIAAASATSTGALSASDWSAFNGKVSTVTAAAPLASSGGTSPQITLGVVPVTNGGTGLSTAMSGVVVGGSPMSAIAATGAGQVFRRNTAGTAYEFIAPSGGGDPVGTARAVSTNTTLTGGGDLSANRTLGLNLGNANTWTGAQTFTAAGFTSLQNNTKLVRIRVDCPTGPCAILVADAAAGFAQLRLTGPNEFSLVDTGSIVNFVAYANGTRIAGGINNANACSGAPPLCVNGSNNTCNTCRFDTGAQGTGAKDFRIHFGQPGSTLASIQTTTELSLLQDISGNGTRWGGWAITSEDQAGQ